MLKKIWRALVRRYGAWRMLHVALGSAIAGLATVLLLEAALPIRTEAPAGATGADVELAAAAGLLDGRQSPEKAAARIARVLRPGLFKSAAPLGDKPMADKTIEKILSQLKLQCIVQIDGQPTAYINVENGGLKKCRVGETVADLFTVVNVNKKSVELTIIGHPVTLSL